MIQLRRTPSESRAPTTPESTFDRGSDVRTRLPIGTVLDGKYRLDRVVGVGAMGSVFAATHLRNGNRVAIKVLHDRSVDGSSDVRIRFLREGRAANSVRHAGTVRVLDDGIAIDGTLFLVMELLEGETLQALWERGGRVPPWEVAQLMWQVLDVLSAAHAKGIVHRDVKPENLFVERNGTVRLLDFGVARLLPKGALTETRAGSVLGTLPYMAPEQMLGKIREVDARSDVWSVGATAFTLISGRFVHEAETPEEMLVFTASRRALSLAEAAPRVPRAVTEVVDRALRFDKRDRWPSARAMQSALADAYRWTQRAEERLEVSGARPVPSRKPPREKAGVGLTPHSSLTGAGAVASVAVSTMCPRLGIALSRVARMRRPGPAANSTARATRRAARWAGVAVLVVVVVAALTAYAAARIRPAAVRIPRPRIEHPMTASAADGIGAPLDACPHDARVTGGLTSSNETLNTVVCTDRRTSPLVAR